MKTFAIFVAILASATFVADAPAQTRAPRPVGQSSPPLGGQTLAQKEEQAVEGRTESRVDYFRANPDHPVSTSR